MPEASPSKTKVSVVVPVYNAGTYLEACLRSLTMQSLPECEFIVVNDGSTDGSREMIERFRNRDPRIRLINQDNQGVSAARNRGIEAASGEFVGFVDADDSVASDMYETLYRAAESHACDAVIANLVTERGGGKRHIAYPFPTGRLLGRAYIRERVLPYFLRESHLNTVCSKLFRTRIIKEREILFPHKVPLGEDGLFNMRFFRHAGSMLYLPYSGYHYREADGSATRSPGRTDYFRHAVEAYRMDLGDIYEGILQRDEVVRLQSIKLINHVMALIHVYWSTGCKLSFADKHRIVKSMVKHPAVRESVPIFVQECRSRLSRYEKLLVHLIRRKSTIGLYGAVSYSRFRNGGHF